MKTPEQVQAKAREDAAAKFCREMLAMIRKRLFTGRPEKEWWQSQSHVRQAIMEPARYLQERGAALPASRYRIILLTVLVGIEQHANRAEIHRMAVYFLHAVQEHMKHQGERYYEEGKTPRGIDLMVGSALKSLQGRVGDRDITAALSASAAILAQRGGRKRKQPPRGVQKELF
jgi:hypothetical protein